MDRHKIPSCESPNTTEIWNAATLPIWAMVSGYAKPHRHDRPLMFMQVYMDDSAADWGDRRLHIAGYMLSVLNWTQFNDAWKSILDASPAVPYFKMSEAMGGGDQATKIEPLAAVIQHFSPIALHCSVSRAEYERYFSDRVRKDIIESPYFLCYYGAINGLTGILSKVSPVSHPVDFIFDMQGTIIEDEARLWYRVIKSILAPELAQFLGREPRFEDDITTLPLQAADMLAWTLRRDRDPVYGNEPATKDLLEQINPKPIDFSMSTSHMESIGKKLEFVRDFFEGAENG